MNRAVGDIEVYPNFFCATFVDYDGEGKRVFEISERKNDLDDLVQFLGEIKYMMGFNNIHYDNLILNCLYKEHSKLKGKGHDYITGELKKLNDLIILDDNEQNYKKYSKYKYNQPFRSIDIFLYWSKLTRKSRKLSLKSMAVNINWHRIQELPLGPNHVVTLDQMDAILEYNLNDSLVTKAVMMKMRKDINLRAEAQKRYGFDCMSWDGVKLGYNILLKRYCDRTKLPFDEVKQMRTHRESVHIGSLILPVVKFQEGDLSYIQFIEDKKLITRFKSFAGLHNYLKDLTVENTKQINCQVLHNGVRYDVKSGGLHTFHNPGVQLRRKGKKYKDKDVSSYYPTLGAEWSMIPEHLGNEFAEELDSVRHERLDLKARGLGKSNESELLKLAMNGGFYGNTNNEYTAMYDMRCMLNITINGQLLLLMLCEKLIEIGVEVDMCNTDGITIIYDEPLEEQVEEICKWWQGISRMELETVDYVKVARMNINNYLALYEEKGENKTKPKGMFLIDPPIDMSRDFLVIPKALNAYYTEGKDLESFIKSHDNIYDFCACQKVDKTYAVVWNGATQQRLNRYYVTKSGPYLYKSKNGSMENMLKGYSVQLFNDYKEAPMDSRNIDYSFYVAEAKKLLNQLEPQQLSMF